MAFNQLITRFVAACRNNVLKNNGQPTVIELGNQTLRTGKLIKKIFNGFGIDPNTTVSTVKDYYIGLGFTKYLAIDVNTDKDAVAMDLNLDIVNHYNFKEKFDLVTNNGTGEHCFNQYNVFLNTHNLCKKNGFIVHVLPFYRFFDHGFYNFHPNLFISLAHHNEYVIHKLCIASSDCEIFHEFDVSKNYFSENFLKNINIDQYHKDIMIAVIYEKNHEKPFRMPMQHVYGGSNINSDDITQRYYEKT